MRRSRKPILIASRRSRLARIQAEMVGRALGKLHPNLSVSYRWIESEGDRHDEAMLADIGGKGLFTNAVEQAVLNREADLAVHSLKDLPAADSTGLVLAAIARRGDVRDCLISDNNAQTLEQLKPGAVLGTASPRRAAQALAIRPDLQIKLMRGNVETRVNKVLKPEGDKVYDATLLARAGLIRSGLNEHAKAALPVEQMLPAACQGALGIQCRTDDHTTLERLLRLNDPVTAAAVHAERQVVAALQADCHAPLAVLVEPVETPADAPKRRGRAEGSTRQDPASTWFRLRVRVLATDGQGCLEIDDIAPAEDLRYLIRESVADLIARGAAELLAKAKPAGNADQSVQDASASPRSRSSRVAAQVPAGE